MCHQGAWSEHVPYRLYCLEVTGKSFMYKMVSAHMSCVAVSGGGLVIAYVLS